jgi:hypothetical protein
LHQIRHSSEGLTGCVSGERRWRAAPT